MGTGRIVAGGLGASLALAGCVAAPPLDTGDAPPPAATLSGDLLIAGTGDATGRGIVLRYDPADPPPPEGFGRPVDLAVVPDSAWTRPAPDAMAQAPWSMTGVEDGTWILAGLVDADGDFNPAYDFTAGATCGDRPGAFLGRPTDTEPLPLAVSGPAHLDGVDILLGDPLPTERPAFTIEPSTTAIDQLAAAPQFVQLHSTGIDHPLLHLSPPDAEACPTVFWFATIDEDGDGAADPHPNADLAAAGFAAAWPRVYLLLAAPDDPSVLADGSTWITELPLLEALGAIGAEPIVEPLDTLSGTWPGAVLRLGPDGAEEVVAPPDVPEGGWAVLVVSQSGQLWMVPNQLADPTVASALCEADASLCTDPDPEQGAVVTILSGTSG